MRQFMSRLEGTDDKELSASLIGKLEHLGQRQQDAPKLILRQIEVLSECKLHVRTTNSCISNCTMRRIGA
jgi:hypothetical protein